MIRLSPLGYHLCSLQVMIFLFSKRISTRLGVHGVLYVSTVCYGVRLFAYGYWVSSAWWLVIFEPMHALTFSLPMVSS